MSIYISNNYVSDLLSGGDTSYHDFVLLVLEKPVTYGHKGAFCSYRIVINPKSDIMHVVGPICLPKPEMEFDSYEAQTAGWGMTGAGGEQSDTLHYVKLRVSSRKYPHDTFLGTKVQKKKGKLQTVCEGDDGSQTITNYRVFPSNLQI